MSDPEPPGLLSNRFAEDAGGASPVRRSETCFRSPDGEMRFHRERQDTSLPGWRRMVELIDEAVADGREVFRPLVELSPAEREDLVTLPPSIAGLTRVRELSLYGSPLVRIPPEIGAMESLWPLLVNACSTACVQALPMPPKAYVSTPHQGGPAIEQPPPR